MLKIGRDVKWDGIEVGEVYYGSMWLTTGFRVCVKIDSKTLMVLADSTNTDFASAGAIFHYDMYPKRYKLPYEIQKWWITPVKKKRASHKRGAYRR